ncbi:MAG: hypothetical protein LCI03_20595 [Actinobacteria bacterium]|nr:hypothetical protein [Actinomycetota bacterium]
MMPPTPQEWRALLLHLHDKRLPPFDGRKQSILLAFAMTLSHSNPRNSRVSLKLAREVYGERRARKYVSVLVHGYLLEMVVKPARPKKGRDGRVALYEFRCPDSRTNDGSDTCGESWHRSCSEADDDQETQRARTLPSFTLKPSCLSVGATSSDASSSSADEERLHSDDHRVDARRHSPSISRLLAGRPPVCTGYRLAMAS